MLSIATSKVFAGFPEKKPKPIPQLSPYTHKQSTRLPLLKSSHVSSHATAESSKSISWPVLPENHGLRHAVTLPLHRASSSAGEALDKRAEPIYAQHARSHKADFASVSVCSSSLLHQELVDGDGVGLAFHDGIDN
jgi:hypothetical protein